MGHQERRHILVVDDSLEYLRFMEFLLQNEGFSVGILNSAESLASHVNRQRPDLIITDVRMPGLAPFEVFERLRADSDTANIPVLLCTGAVNEVKEHPELATSGAQVLFKPFDVDALFLKIATILADPPSVTVA